MLGDQPELCSVRDEAVVDLPRVEHRLGEHEARVARQRVLIEIAPISDDAEDRKLPIVDHVANRVARLEQARALDHHERSRAAEVQAGGDFPRLALAADAHDARASPLLDGRLPLADRAVRNGDDVRDAELARAARRSASPKNIARQFAFGRPGSMTRFSMKNSIMRCWFRPECP